MPRVTVGVTSYNAASYVTTCFESLVAQTIDASEVEVIVVDDGSTDETVELVGQYVERAPWSGFRILTQKNSGGPATGRNRILEAAEGEFVLFMDIDDYLGPMALDRMTKRGLESGAEIVLGKFVGVGRGVPKYIFRESRVRTNIVELSLTDSMNVLKMFRTSFVRNVGYQFNAGLRMAEDHPFTLAAYTRAERVAIEADVDCYFCVRHSTLEGAAQHLTGHTLPVEQFYAYMHESFGVLGLARAAQAPYAEAAKLRYWDRLLGLDIPGQLSRDRGKEGNSESIASAREVIEQYGADALAPSLRRNANVMLHALKMRDETAVLSIAQQVRKGVWS